MPVDEIRYKLIRSICILRCSRATPLHHHHRRCFVALPPQIACFPIIPFPFNALISSVFKTSGTPFRESLYLSPSRKWLSDYLSPYFAMPLWVFSTDYPHRPTYHTRYLRVNIILFKAFIDRSNCWYRYEIPTDVKPRLLSLPLRNNHTISR